MVCIYLIISKNKIPKGKVRDTTDIEIIRQKELRFSRPAGQNFEKGIRAKAQILTASETTKSFLNRTYKK